MPGEELALLLLPAERAVHFIRLWPPRQAQAKRQFRARVSVRTGTAHHPAGQGLGGFEKCRIVQRRERLERRIGSDAAHRANLAAGRVEVEQAGIRRGAADEGVNSAPVAILATALFPLLIVVRKIPDAFRLRRKYAQPADLRTL